MRTRTLRLGVIVAAATISVALAGAAWAAPASPGDLLQKSVEFNSGSIELYGAGDAQKTTPHVRPVGIGFAPDSTVKSWIDALDKNDPNMSLLGLGRLEMLAALKKLSFLVDIQVQRGQTDITAFSENPLNLKLAFKDVVPDQIFLIAGQAPELLIAAVQTREYYRIYNDFYDLEVHREPGQPKIVWLTVRRWPPGDPHCGG
jgi:hypothetical protein